MATIITPYTDINATMKGIRIQVIDSLDFCVNEMPTFQDPAQMFRALKNMVVYKNDPPGIELLQSVPTLFNYNYWNIPGAGGGIGGVLDKIGGVVGNIMGTTPTNRDLDISVTDQGLNIDTSEQTFFEQYRTPLIIGGVVVAAGIGYYIYNQSQKTK